MVRNNVKAREAKLGWAMKIKPHQRLRHLVMEVDGRYYLIDQDRLTFLLGYICPIFHWILSHTVKEIHLSEGEVIERLIRERSRQKKRTEDSKASWVVIFVLVLALPLLYNIIDNFQRDVLFTARFLIFIFCIISTIILRIYLSHSGMALEKEIGESKLSEVKIRIYPNEMKSKFKRIGVLYVNYLMVVGSFVVFLSMGGWVLLAFGLIVLFFVSFGNNMLLMMDRNMIEFLEGDS